MDSSEIPSQSTTKSYRLSDGHEALEIPPINNHQLTQSDGKYLKDICQQINKSTFDFNTKTPLHQHFLPTTYHFNNGMSGNENQRHKSQIYNFNTAMTNNTHHIRRNLHIPSTQP